MGKMTLSGGFTPLPAGKTILKIESVDDSKLNDFGKLVLVMVTKEGRKHWERYSFLTSGGGQNDTAHWAFSTLARAALNLPAADVREIDTDELVGKYIECEVVHYTGSDGKTYANLGKEKKHAEGFSGAETANTVNTTTEAPKAAEKPAEDGQTKKYDLKSLLG